MPRQRRWRLVETSPVLLFTVIVALSLLLAVGYVALAVLRAPGRSAAVTPSPTITGPAAASNPITSTAGPGETELPVASEVMFQHIGRDGNYAHVATVDAGAPGGPRAFTELVCERVHYAGGRGLCLVPHHGLVTTYEAQIFGADQQVLGRLDLFGPPSRARVSADGRYGAATVFVFGHSYADAVFSTQTIIVDMARGVSLGELEDFTTIRDGETWSAEDFNFWGVTFSGQASDRIFATLRTAGRTYLVEGSVERRELRVVHDDVECPSISPDGTRIAFKKVTAGLIGQWRLHVLDLASNREWPLAEEANIDDQVEWLDDRTVLYGNAGAIWAVPGDGTGSPQLLIADALSPAVLR
jgi:hypothetical protein